MNILITAPSLNPDKNVSGISSVVQNIIEYNKTHTYFHYLLGRPDKPLNKFRLLGRMIKQLVYFPFYLKKNHIQIVHQNFPLEPKGVLRESVISFWCKLLKKPVVLHVHGGRFITKRTDGLFSILIKSIIRNSKTVIVLSDLEKKVLSNNFDYKNALIVPNCIDTTLYNTHHKQTSSGTTPIFLYLGRIEKNKGINELIDALKLLEKDYKFQFYLCGEGPMRDQIVETMNKVLGENFKYLGVVSGQQKIDTIKKSTYFLLPSYFEGLPMALLETMAAGVIPIVTNVGSVGKVVTNGLNGIYVKEKDAIDLYNKMKQVLRQSETMTAISDNAKKTILSEYDIRNYVIRLNHIYNSAINNA